MPFTFELDIGWVKYGSARRTVDGAPAKDAALPGKGKTTSHADGLQQWKHMAPCSCSDALPYPAPAQKPFLSTDTREAFEAGLNLNNSL